jgi:hypothetical protein
MATWTAHLLDYHVSLNDKSNVVHHVHWRCADGEAQAYGSVDIATDDLSDFTVFNDITEAQAVQWAQTALGADEVAAVEARVAADLALLASPTEGSGTPWLE